MIRFFKKIRQNILAQNKYSKYLLYALGEIVLVVIGILIALAINNANQNRINAKYEKTYLLGLKEEFETSKRKLTELLAVNQKNYNGAKEILRLASNRDQMPTEETFSLLLFNTFSSDVAFNPNNSLLFEMINSGNLKNLSNTTLRIKLTNWVATMDDISRQEAELGVQREKVLDMFRTDQNSLGTIYKYAGVYETMELPTRAGERSNLNLLNAPAFENNLLMFILTCHATENAHYLPLMKDLDGILQLIEADLENK